MLTGLSLIIPMFEVYLAYIPLFETPHETRHAAQPSCVGPRSAFVDRYVDTSGASLGQQQKGYREVGRCDVVKKNHPNKSNKNDSGHIKHLICIISYHIPMCPPVTAGWILHYLKKKSQPHALSLRSLKIDL